MSQSVKPQHLIDREKKLSEIVDRFLDSDDDYPEESFLMTLAKES